MCLSYFIEHSMLYTMLDLKQNKNKILIIARFEICVQFRCIWYASINMGKYHKDINFMKCECTWFFVPCYKLPHMCTT